MMISLDILQIAEENFLVTFGIVFGIGLLQGAILARGIRRRFPYDDILLMMDQLSLHKTIRQIL